MFLNLSNHPSANWSQEQTEAAMRLYGEIVDLPWLLMAMKIILRLLPMSTAAKYLSMPKHKPSPST